MAQQPSSERFRLFTERYVIQRAPFFRVGHEQEDAWAAMLDARNVYQRIATMDETAEQKP